MRRAGWAVLVLGGMLAMCALCGGLGVAGWAVKRAKTGAAWSEARGGSPARDGASRDGAEEEAEMRERRAPEAARAGGGEVVLRGFRGVELHADARRVFWTEVGVKERRDEPSHITRAAVKGLRHAVAAPAGAGEVETRFDFERDGVRCTPHRLMFVGGELGWFGYREWVEGPFDADRFMLSGAPSPRETPLGGRPHWTTTDGRDVLAVVVERGEAPKLLRVDPRRGSQAVVDVTLEGLGFRRFGSVRVLGATPDFLFGLTDTEARDTRVWRLDLRSGEQATVYTVPRGSFDLKDADFEGGTIALSWGSYGAGDGVAVIDGVMLRERLLLTFEGERAELVRLAGGRLYAAVTRFTQDNVIARVDLDSGARHTLVTADFERSGHSTIAASRLAVGGGFVYWIKDKVLYRHPG